MTADLAKLIFSYSLVGVCSLAILIKIPVGAFYYRSANSIIISREEREGENEGGIIIHTHMTLFF